MAGNRRNTRKVSEMESRKKPEEGENESGPELDNVNNVEDPPRECTFCHVIFTKKEDEMIECGRCDDWVCLECSRLKMEEYVALCFGTRSIHWYCDRCNAHAVKAVKSDNEIEQKCKEYFSTLSDEIQQTKVDLQNNITAVENRVTQVDTRLSKEIDELKKKIKEYEDNPQNSNGTGIEEIAERNKRLQNIVIFNAKESSSEDIEERKLHDKQYVEKLLNDIKAIANIDKINRLGQRVNNKNRPLKIKLNTETEQRNVMSKARALKDLRQYDRVYISRDMTPLEQRQRKVLVIEMKKKQAEAAAAGTQDKWIIRKGRVVKGRQTETPEEPRTEEEEEDQSPT